MQVSPVSGMNALLICASTCNLQVFSGSVDHLEQPHAHSQSFLFSSNFGYHGIMCTTPTKTKQSS